MDGRSGADWGRKAKAGFYAYDESGRRLGLWDGLVETFDSSGAQPDLSDLQQRLLMAQALEAVRALQDGVLMDVREGDVASILGWGFAPWSGGVLSWLDLIGAPKACAVSDDLAARFGARFAAPRLLRDLAETGDSFYGRFLPDQAAA